jgi:hypothetical protein
MPLNRIINILSILFLMLQIHCVVSIHESDLLYLHSGQIIVSINQIYVSCDVQGIPKRCIHIIIRNINLVNTSFLDTLYVRAAPLVCCASCMHISIVLYN